MALSTYLPGQVIDDSVMQQPRDLPILMAHGSFDPVLPMALGKSARESLSAAGFTVDWHEYPMAHAVCPDEITAIRDWLLRVYGESA